MTTEEKRRFSETLEDKELKFHDIKSKEQPVFASQTNITSKQDLRQFRGTIPGKNIKMQKKHNRTFQGNKNIT